METELGYIRELVRYPIKSMAGIPAESANLGWHGIDGDRRFAFRRLEDSSDFPWLTASRVHELLLYQPVDLEDSRGEPLPSHVRTPAGETLELRSAELQRDVTERLGSPVELMQLKHGIFDQASISVISLATLAGIGDKAGLELDRRRFRANIVLETHDQDTFLEDAWVGGTLVFGKDEPRPAVTVTLRDVRCVIVNLDPDTAIQDKRVLKTVVRLNDNKAGVYGTVVQTGTLRVGDPVRLVRDGRR